MCPKYVSFTQQLSTLFIIFVWGSCLSSSAGRSCWCRVASLHKKVAGNIKSAAFVNPEIDAPGEGDDIKWPC